jgi:hypothetical protein
MIASTEIVEDDADVHATGSVMDAIGQRLKHLYHPFAGGDMTAYT